MKVVAAILLGLSVAGCALCYVRRLENRCGALRELTQLFGALSENAFSGDPLSFLRSPRVADLRFAQTVETAALTENVPDAWTLSAENYSHASLLTAAERSALAEFASAFACTSSQAFTLRCRQAASFFDAALARAEAAAAEKRRPALSFGALGAALIFIIVV